MNDRKFLKRAVELARESLKQGGFPAGGLVVKNGKIIAEGLSLGYQQHDPTGHAESTAIRAACQKLKTTDLSGATLYESLECCNMCFSVAYWAGISRIVYATKKTPEMIRKFYYEGSVNNSEINSKNNRKIELIFVPSFEKESLEAVKEWEKKNG